MEASNYKNTEVVKHYGDMTMEKAFEATTPAIGLLAQENETLTRQAIANIFIATSMYFDNVLPMNKAQVLAEELLANYEYRSLKFEDIIVICNELKTAEIYKLTLARILKQIADYNTERLEAAMQRSIKQSEDAKAACGESNIDERIRKSARMIEKSNAIVIKQRMVARKFTDQGNKKNQ